MLYPVLLDLRGRHVLVVGGGAVAARKIAGLVAAGARVTVVASHVSPEARAAGAAAVHERQYTSSDIDGQVFVVVATDDAAVNAAVAADAGRAGIFVNAADDPANCSAILPAVLRRGPVVVAVSTSGSAPALASWLRDRVAEVVDERTEVVAAELAARRREVHHRGQSTESISWTQQIEQLWDSARPHSTPPAPQPDRRPPGSG